MMLSHSSKQPVSTLSAQARPGDVVFIRVPIKIFREVAAATMSWVNHVGVVVSVDGDEPLIAESTFPLSCVTPMSRFIERSESGRVAISRLPEPLTASQQSRLHAAAQARLGILYDTGFNLHSSRQFCSKFVREVLAEATGRQLGEVESFATLLNRNPRARLGFWKLWYFGHIPWERETVTPASLLRCAELELLFDGAVCPQGADALSV
jgi:hypothetical protein